MSSKKHRYGFQGQEKDDEIKGEGNSYSFEARIYDPRVGRWLSIDPCQMQMPSHSSYSFCYNSPNIFTDFGGDKPDPVFVEGTALWDYMRDKYMSDLQSLNDACNIRLSHFYAYAMSNGKAYEYQVKGAFGEAYVYRKLLYENSKLGGNINRSYWLAPLGASTKTYLGEMVEGYQIDILVELTLVSITTNVYGNEVTNKSEYNILNTDLAGKVSYTQIEVYADRGSE